MSDLPISENESFRTPLEDEARVFVMEKMMKELEEARLNEDVEAEEKLWEQIEQASKSNEEYLERRRQILD